MFILNLIKLEKIENLKINIRKIASKSRSFRKKCSFLTYEVRNPKNILLFTNLWINILKNYLNES